jgi:hypothetical protein
MRLASLAGILMLELRDKPVPRFIPHVWVLGKLSPNHEGLKNEDYQLPQP